MQNFKLQYRPEEPNHWHIDGIPIAPQDQEKVNFKVWGQHSISKVVDNVIVKEITFDNWEPNESKLYDSGDLEFELTDFVNCTGSSWIEPKWCGTCKNTGCGCEMKQFWTLKEKAKEETPSMGQAIMFGPKQLSDKVQVEEKESKRDI